MKLLAGVHWLLDLLEPEPGPETRAHGGWTKPTARPTPAAASGPGRVKTIAGLAPGEEPPPFAQRLVDPIATDLLARERPATRPLVLFPPPAGRPCDCDNGRVETGIVLGETRYEPCPRCTIYAWRCPDCGGGVTKIHVTPAGLAGCGMPPGYWQRAR